jgi:hypothetical protein
MPIDLLDSVTRSISLTSAAGISVDADATPTYAITLPDGTAGIAPAVQHGVTGEYYVVYPTTVSGLHRELWTAVVAGVMVVIRRELTVEQAGTAFVDVDEAIAHLRGAGIIVSASDLEQLRWLCQVSCEAVEGDLGRTISRRAVTDVSDGGRTAVILRSTPVISVTTVTESGTTLTADQYTADLSSGIVYRGGQQSVQCWAWGRQNVSVAYVAGYLNPPKVARKVALNGVQRMWQHSQQEAHPALDADFAVAVAVGNLTPLEMAAYRALAGVGIG